MTQEKFIECWPQKKAQEFPEISLNQSWNDLNFLNNRLNSILNTSYCIAKKAKRLFKKKFCEKMLTAQKKRKKRRHRERIGYTLLTYLSAFIYCLRLR